MSLRTEANGYAVDSVTLGRTRIYRSKTQRWFARAHRDSPNGLKTSVVTGADGGETTTDAGTVSSSPIVPIR